MSIISTFITLFQLKLTWVQQKNNDKRKVYHYTIVKWC